MAAKACIKGSIVAGHAENLKKYLAEAQPSQPVLDQAFRAGEIELLTGPIDSIKWYDIRTYERLLIFLRDHLGDGRKEYLVAAGRRSAQKLLDAGIHQQFEYLSRTQVASKTDKHERHAAFGRDLRLLSTISGAILNFTTPVVIPDPDNTLRWIIEHADAADYPEPLCWTAQGFNNRMAEVHGVPDLWYWERPRPDVVRFRMNREV